MPEDTTTDQVKSSSDPDVQSGMRERDESDAQRQEDRRDDQLEGTAGDAVEDASGVRPDTPGR